MVQVHYYEQKQKRRISCFWLSLYWLQMCLCLWEAPLRFFWHAAMWLLFSPTLWCTGTRPRRQADDAQTSSLPLDQSTHHAVKLQIYRLCLQVVVENMRHPKDPIYVYHASVNIVKPEKPKPPPPVSSNSWNCLESCDCPCACSCDCCVEGCVNFLRVADSICLRLLRSSFFFLGAYRSLQCGSLLGPCAEPCCYAPCIHVCAGGQRDQGCCSACEPEVVRIERWVREFYEDEVRRSVEFYDARPDLQRPRSLPARSVPSHSMKAPTQMLDLAVA